MPLPEVALYMKQLCNALSTLHSTGWVHCDLKAEQVVASGPPGYVAKLVDFGMAEKIGTVGFRRLEYSPPETLLPNAKVTPALDCWGLGLILWWMVVDLHKAADTSIPTITYGLRDKWPPAHLAMARHEDVREALCGLLEWDPEKRWTIDRLLQSRLMTHALEPSTVHRPVEAPAPGLVWQSHHQVPYLVFGVQIKKGSQLVGKYLGRNDQVPADAPALNLTGSVQILFIERAGLAQSVISQPKAEDRLQVGDWVFVTRDKDSMPQHELFALDQEQMKGNASDIRGGAIQFFPEFDEFFFPPGCAGAIIGAGAGTEKALDLRHRFGINLAGIWRIDGDERKLLFGPREVTKSTVIQEGDIGLVFRWIDKASGQSEQMLSDATVTELASAFPSNSAEPEQSG